MLFYTYLAVTNLFLIFRLISPLVRMYAAGDQAIDDLANKAGNVALLFENS